MTTDPAIAALIALHDGMERLGPGDETRSLSVLRSLPPLPDGDIADLGCGTGATALMLARETGERVRAVDFAPTFLATLGRRAAAAGLGDRIEPVEADFGALAGAPGWPDGCLKLLWSEGAAYTLTFAGALAAWKPLLAQGGVAVISEMSWFTDDRPAEAARFWDAAYPAMGTETENIAHAQAAGFAVLEFRRLPAEAWWAGYYDPLLARCDALEAGADTVMMAAIDDTRREAALFRRFAHAYGYTVYVLRK